MGDGWKRPDSHQTYWSVPEVSGDRVDNLLSRCTIANAARSRKKAGWARRRGGAARDARSLALRIGSYILSGSALRRVPPDGD